MTVAELIDKLKTLPPTYEVFTIYDTGHSFPLVTNVVADEKFKVVLIQDTNGEPGQIYLGEYPFFDRWEPDETKNS